MPGNRRYIPANIKELIVSMGHDPEMNPRRIRELTGVSERTQYRVAALLRETGEVVRTPVVAGRPCKLDALDAAVCPLIIVVMQQCSADILQFLEGCIERQPDMLLEELQTRLREVCEVEVSVNTIRETLKSCGFTRKLVCDAQ